jgi:hypothetical protein
MYFLYPWGFWVSQIVIFWSEQMWTIDYQVFIEGRYLQLGFPYILILALKVTLLQPPLRLGILKFFTQMAFHIYIYIFLLKIFGCLHKHGLICLHQMNLQYEKFERSILKFFESHYQFQWVTVTLIHLRGPWSTTIVHGIHIICFYVIISFTFEYFKPQFCVIVFYAQLHICVCMVLFVVFHAFVTLTLVNILVSNIKALELSI